MLFVCNGILKNKFRRLQTQERNISIKSYF